MTRRAAAALGFCAALAACRPSTRNAPVAVPAPSPQTHAWARQVLSRLTLEEKAAQLIGVRVFGLYKNPRSSDVRRLMAEVQNLKVGTVVVFDSEVESVPRVLNELQAAAPTPLLVAADLERGLAQRIRRGVVPLPDAMAIGATRSEEAARFAGEVTAREARAVGIHWAFAPVADVNSNPANPIVNVRSFGEDPEVVGRLTAAFVQGAREGGLLTTAKHFPGHGDTSVDSHLQLATLTADRDRLRGVELLPFRRAIQAGVDAVMLGHIAAPALDATGTPASLSEPMVRVLREEMGFSGLVVTDAMEMQGVRAAWTGEAAVRAVQAGADVVLLPPDPEVAVKALVRAVQEGGLSEARLDVSVRRILEAKERLGLDRKRDVDASAIGKSVDRPEDVERALDVARQSITVVRNERRVLPLKAEGPLRILHLVLSSDARNDAIQGFPEEELAERRIPTDTVNLGPDVSEETAARLLAAAREHTHVVASCFIRVRARKGSVDMAESHARLLRALMASGTPVIVVSFGSPYLLAQIPEASAYVCAYGASESSQRAAVEALFGEYAVGGTLPVTLPGLHPIGYGLKIPRREMTLRTEGAEAAGFRPEGLAEADRTVEEFVASKAFPGAVVAVGRDGALAHLRAFGHLTYDDGSPAVAVDTLYDLASLTKVVATTTMAMILVDEGKLDLGKPVSSFLPGFHGGAKDKVTVWHLLTHSGGLDWWGPLYKELKGKDAYLHRIEAMDLVYEPGTKSLYSDLGAFLLGEVLERVAGEGLDTFARRRIFEPLGMKDTLFRPGPDLLPRIAPTELDPWRGRLLRGEVHDENAFALGGVAPHAGLFGTAPDLARFAQMLLNGGVYDHHRLVSRETVELFTRRAGVPGSSRALGWDTPSAGSSAGSLFSARSFGHTGFTGTSVWVDPDRRLFLVLLTNRVHPTRENDAIRKARPAVADAVVRALAAPSRRRVNAKRLALACLLLSAGSASAGDVQVGLERLDVPGGGVLRGKRIGLLCHRASVTADGRRAVDVLRSRGVDVVRLFTPEHGLGGNEGAGVAVAGGRDAATGVPVVSLYGAKTGPSPRDLMGLDALVVDLQDVGVRFYTYAATMLLSIEAARAAGLEIVVLDRPNPLGGEGVEGPEADVPSGSRSLLTMAPGPLVHGLTLGEMARLASAGGGARLTVVPMTGWSRTMRWGDTGRRWLPPSPNLRTPEAALVYPGVALLEATNVSEGRGTGDPFLLFGAPWLQARELIDRVRVEGVRLEPASFVPAASRAAPQPKFEGVRCVGARISIVGAETLRPYAFGLSLLAALRATPGFRWLDEGRRLDALLGTPRVREALDRGTPIGEILARDGEAITRFRARVKDLLLY